LRLFDWLKHPVGAPFVLTNPDGDAGQSTQPVTLFLTVTVSPISPINTTDLQSTEVNKSSPREDTSSITQGSMITTRSTVAVGSETVTLPADHLPSEMSTPPPPDANRSAGMSLAENALQDAGEAVTTIDLSDTWEGALERIKWVMDTLSPVGEVRFNELFVNP
jgi:hypothetical protein